MNAQLDPATRLRRIRLIHDLHREQRSLRQIATLVGVHKETVAVSLAHSYPTDEEIAAADASPAGRQDSTGRLRSIKVNIPPELHQNLCEEAERQGASLSMLGNLALALYLDAINRYRSGTQEPINLHAFLPSA